MTLSVRECCPFFMHVMCDVLAKRHFGNGDRVGNVGVSAPTADRQTQAAPVLESGIAT